MENWISYLKVYTLTFLRVAWHYLEGHLWVDLGWSKRYWCEMTKKKEQRGIRLKEVKIIFVVVWIKRAVRTTDMVIRSSSLFGQSGCVAEVWMRWQRSITNLHFGKAYSEGGRRLRGVWIVRQEARSSGRERETESHRWRFMIWLRCHAYKSDSLNLPGVFGLIGTVLTNIFLSYGN